MYLSSLEHLNLQTLLLYSAPLGTDHRKKCWSLPLCVWLWTWGIQFSLLPVIVSHMSSWYTLTYGSLILQEKVKYK